MSSYTIKHNMVADTHQRKQLGSSNIAILRAFNKTIIPLALGGYEIVIANEAPRASLAIYHLISKARSWLYTGYNNSGCRVL